MNSVETPVRAFEFQTPWDKAALRVRRAGDISTIGVPTNIYHVSYTPEAKEVSLFFWGCNFGCRECLCKKNVYNYLITENLGLFDAEPICVAGLPTRFLNIDELTEVLDALDVSTILLEGQEASLDPVYLPITEMLHKRYGTKNVLCTNAYRLPPLDHTDAVQISLKAFNDDLHRDYTGKSNTKVFENVINLYKSGRKISLASLLIPDYITGVEISALPSSSEASIKTFHFTSWPFSKRTAASGAGLSRVKWKKLRFWPEGILTGFGPGRETKR